MGDVNSGGVFSVVHDGMYAEHGRSLAASLGIMACDLSGLKYGSLSKANVVIDVNLQDLAAIAALKAALGEASRLHERIFLMDDGLQLRASRVQAAALGASRTLIRGKTTLTEILKCDLVPRPGAATLVQHEGLADRPGGGSIVAASDELARLFDGVVSGQPLDMGQVTAASAQILNGMSKVGEGAWLDLVRAHHEGTFQHCLLVAGVAARYAQFTGLRREYAHLLVNAAMLHDVGKAVVPLSILDKPGRLTDEERAVIERHPGAGFDYLAKQSGLPKAVLDAVRHHHEMLDGSGYPDRLSGATVLPLARVLAVCDIFAALIEVRSYKPARSSEDAVKVLVGMVLSGKLEEVIVRRLASAFGVELPTDLAEDSQARPYLRA